METSVAEAEDGINLLPQAWAKRDRTGATRKVCSWIWRTPRIVVDGVETADNENPDILHSEWVKSRVHAARASEEVSLVHEEMRKTLAYLEWKSKWWLAQQVLRVVSNMAMAEGIRAYASQQAELQAVLASSFWTLWKTPLDEIKDGINDDNMADHDANSDDDNKNRDTIENENVHNPDININK
jgi:hypothetical protein